VLLAALAAAREATQKDDSGPIVPMEELVALCRVTAFTAAHLGVPRDELLAAIDTHYGRERDAHQEKPDAD
jgi:hypothetical protein